MIFIFEMANNHQGSLEHGKIIVDTYAKLAKKYDIKCAIKLQFRQLDTFIHEDFKDSNVKHVKRFNDTRLSKSEFQELTNYIKNSGMLAAATPFDNESVGWLEEFNVDIVKIASCSIDDWPLLIEIAKLNKKTVISTGGASDIVIDKAYDLFKKSNNHNVSFLHCVSEYPTPIENANLYRIKFLKDRFRNIDVGYSTHESPEEASLVPYAIAMGAKIIEKHVGVETDKWKLNKYSANPVQIEALFIEIKKLILASESNNTENKNESACLRSLKRGIYFKNDIDENHIIQEDDLYYAMPLQVDQLDASFYLDVIGKKINTRKNKDETLEFKDVSLMDDKSHIDIRFDDPVDRFDLSYAFANNHGSLGNKENPIDEMVEIAKEYNVRCALVHPYDIKYLVNMLKDTNTRPEVLIDFPDGLSGIASKKMQAKIAKDAGAVGGDLVINLHAVQKRDRDTIFKEFKSVVDILEDVKVIAQIPYLWRYDRLAIPWIIDIAVEAGVYCIKDWTTRENFLMPNGEKLDYTEETRIQYLKYIKNYIQENNLPLIIKIAGRVTKDNARLFVKEGASLIGLSYRKTKSLREALK